MGPSLRGVLVFGLVGLLLLPIAMVLPGVLFNPSQAPATPHRPASPQHASASEPA
jgi:hypothetical protein